MTQVAGMKNDYYASLFPDVEAGLSMLYIKTRRIVTANRLAVQRLPALMIDLQTLGGSKLELKTLLIGIPHRETTLLFAAGMGRQPYYNVKHTHE